MRGFFLGIDDTDGGDGGDYLRSFGAELPPTAEGASPETISAEILNTSVIELAEMSMTHSIDAFWASLDPETSRVTGETVTGNHPIGRHIIAARGTEHRDRVTPTGECRIPSRRPRARARPSVNWDFRRVENGVLEHYVGPDNSETRKPCVHKSLLWSASWPSLQPV